MQTSSTCKIALPATTAMKLQQSTTPKNGCNALWKSISCWSSARFRLVTLAWLLLLTLTVSCNTTRTIRIHFEGQDTVESISALKPLTANELHQLHRSLDLIALIDPTQQYGDFSHIPIRWMNTVKYSGLTLSFHNQDQMILLDASLKIKRPNNSWDYLKLGMTASHELSHALNNTTDPHTETITDGRILKLIKDNPELITTINNWQP